MRTYAIGMLEIAFRCLAAAAFCAVFAGIYELFSHGVYSIYMIGAFAIPLVLGAGPASWIGLYARGRAGEEDPGRACPGADKGRIENTVPENENCAMIVAGESASMTDAGESDGMTDAGESDGVTAICEGGTGRYGEETAWESEADSAGGICMPGRISTNAWYSGIAALTVGCIFRGVLEIYGTTNRMIIVYPVAGAILMAAGLAAFLMARLTVNRVTAVQ